ncbi:MAG: glycosyltransferase [Acidobacteria bacterium]|nr:MAG: glycosyltransferase [Acidobacteriota bacterium]
MTAIEALLGRAFQRHQEGSLAEAESLYRQVIQTEPWHPEAWCFLGVLQVQQGRLEDAAASLQEAIRLRPQFAEAHCNLGTVFLHQRKLDRAVACYQEALRIQPALPDAHSNLGKAYCELHRYREAEISCRRAVELAPHHADALLNLGNALECQGKLEEAVACCEQAVRYQPHLPEAYVNLGVARSAQGRPQEAVACFDEALRLRPGFPDAHWGRSLAWLLAGDFERGWPEYESRWQCKPFPQRTFAQPAWDGSPLDGKRILVYAEQGLGDTFQFVRYLPLVKRQGGRVIFACHERLVPLLRSCEGIDQFTTERDATPPLDVHVALLSLPMIFRTTLATVPAKVPYLSAEAGLIEQWRREVMALPGFKVGIAWQGDPGYALDNLRSIALPHFEPLARVPGVSLVSLQKGPGAQQVAELNDKFPLTDWSSRLDVAPGAFMDTAAVMRSLDLVICSDSAVAHLAGALGVPVWLALPYSPDFRWMLHREDSPWYPTMRLFRQTSPCDWKYVFERMARELSKGALSRGSVPILTPKSR